MLHLSNGFLKCQTLMTFDDLEVMSRSFEGHMHKNMLNLTIYFNQNFGQTSWVTQRGGIVYDKLEDLGVFLVRENYWDSKRFTNYLMLKLDIFSVRIICILFAIIFSVFAMRCSVFYYHALCSWCTLLLCTIFREFNMAAKNKLSKLNQ